MTTIYKCCQLHGCASLLPRWAFVNAVTPSKWLTVANEGNGFAQIKIKLCLPDAVGGLPLEDEVSAAGCLCHFYNAGWSLVGLLDFACQCYEIVGAYHSYTLYIALFSVTVALQTAPCNASNQLTLSTPRPQYTRIQYELNHSCERRLPLRSQQNRLI